MTGTAIASIRARQVYTNRGNPGVEAVVATDNGAVGRAMCTSGISIGTHEIEFAFDGGTKFRGKGVMGAVNAVNGIIAPTLLGMDASDQATVDRAMHPTSGPVINGSVFPRTAAAPGVSPESGRTPAVKHSSRRHRCRSCSLIPTTASTGLETSAQVTAAPTTRDGRW